MRLPPAAPPWPVSPRPTPEGLRVPEGPRGAGELRGPKALRVPRCRARRALRAPTLLAALAALSYGDAAAQTRTCTLVQGGTMNQFTSAGLGVIQQFGGPVVFRCAGGVLIRSRRATVLETRREVRLEGDVLYRDSVQELRSDYLQRRTADGFMLARGSVVMRDLSSGSEIRGNQMTRIDRTGQPIETRVTGQPHATLYREEGEAAPPGALGAPAPEGVPIDVDGDSIILVGPNVFRAVGNVRFERGADLDGSGRSLQFDDATGRLRIDGEARVNGERYDLSGDRVDALTVEGAIREVSAFGNAVVEGESMYLEAPEVYMFFERELLQRLEARSRAPRVAAAPPPPPDTTPGADSAALAGARRGGRVGLAERPALARDSVAGPPAPGAQPAAPGAAPRGRDAGRADAAPAVAPLAGAPVGDSATVDAEAPQVYARAEGLEVWADSLNVLSPDERLETLTAVGVAHGVRIADPLAVAALPEGYADEWVKGDTVVAHFAADTSTAAARDAGAASEAAVPADSAARVLKRLEAVGHGPLASAFSHVAGDAPGEYTLNYLIARRIVMIVEGGEAREVQAEGTLRGVYLTPTGQPEPEPVLEETQ